jgi:hypothetical protein
MIELLARGRRTLRPFPQCTAEFAHHCHVFVLHRSLSQGAKAIALLHGGTAIET